MKTITYKGKTLETINWQPLTQEEFEQLKVEYYKKPDFTLVEKELINLKKGKVKYTSI